MAKFVLFRQRLASNDRQPEKNLEIEVNNYLESNGIKTKQSQISMAISTFEDEDDGSIKTVCFLGILYDE